MATPALQLLRRAMPGGLIGALARPGIDELLAGTTTPPSAAQPDLPDGAALVDHWHVERASGVMGPKHVAARVRPMRYDAALLLTNSFSTALVTRLAFIPRRVGYDRDVRGLLLTDRISAERVGGPSWVPESLRSFRPVPAVAYYLHAVRWLLGTHAPPPPEPPMRLGMTGEQHEATGALLARAGLHDRPFGVLNPGGNNPLKRWPPERFAALAEHLWRRHGLAIAINGAPSEGPLVSTIEVLARDRGVPGDAVVALPVFGMTLGTLKGVIRAARLVVTNDTGPRHLAAALGTACVTLFGPTDHRWTTLPDAALFSGAAGGETLASRELFLVADPTLPPDQTADDHPERCRIEKIEFRDVSAAVDRLLGGRATVPRGLAAGLG
jgi:heptosyltransferase-2